MSTLLHLVSEQTMQNAVNKTSINKEQP